MSGYEETFCVLEPCFVYKIPPRSTTQGYKAADWNLEQPVWQGRLRVKGEGLTKLFVQLEDPASSRVFATCRVDPDKMSETLEPVLDSSRYYVLRIEDEATQRHAFIGMGFHERDQSFEFKAALQDFQRRVQNERDLATRSKQDLPKLNLTLKEGETITVDLKTGPSHFEDDEDDEDGGDDFGFLPPPPTGNKKISSMSTKNKSRAQRSPAAPQQNTESNATKSNESSGSSGGDPYGLLSPSAPAASASQPPAAYSSLGSAPMQPTMMGGYPMQSQPPQGMMYQQQQSPMQSMPPRTDGRVPLNQIAPGTRPKPVEPTNKDPFANLVKF